MNKKLLSFISLFLLGVTINAQTILMTDSFETYTAGGFLAQQATPTWTTWSNNPGSAEDATISTEQANSPTQSVKIANTSMDLILPLGNKTSGKFNVSFHYYIPSGFGGYYNIQHYENPGIQWAFEVYFGNGGTGNIKANNITTNFTHGNDEWIFIENIVDIDLDSAWFYVNGSLIHNWQFSTQAGGGAGAAQLGSVNFYGGAITGQTPTYYFDDVTYTELAQPVAPPTINVSTTDVYTNGQAPESFNITNVGAQDMDWIAYPTYPYDVNNITDPAIMTALTHDVSGFTSGLGGFSADVTVKAANKFTPAFLSDAVGQEITSVDIQINDVATNAALLVYERGPFITPGPGNLLHNIPFNITNAGELINVPLPSPLYIDGNDLWIGYVCDADSGTYPLGLDAGPRTAGVNWISTGPGWSEYNLTVDANLIIKGNLQNDPVLKWLTVSPMSGTLTPAQMQTIDLTFNTSGLTPGNYLSVVEIGSNDPAMEYTSVNVHLTVATGINDNEPNLGIMTYPNPTTQNINIKSNKTINSISIYNMNGQLVKSVQVNNLTTIIDVNQLSKGNYLMEINSDNNITKRSIVIQ